MKRSTVALSLFLFLSIFVVAGMIQWEDNERAAAQYFTQSLTTVFTTTQTDTYTVGEIAATTTQTLVQLCGNVPDDPTNLTAHCGLIPIPEFPAGLSVTLSAMLIIAVAGVRRYERRHTQEGRMAEKRARKACHCFLIDS